MGSNHTSSIFNYLKNTCPCSNNAKYKSGYIPYASPREMYFWGTFSAAFTMQIQLQTKFQAKAPLFQLPQSITDCVEFNHCANPFIHLEKRYNHSEWGSHE